MSSNLQSSVIVESMATDSKISDAYALIAKLNTQITAITKHLNDLNEQKVIAVANLPIIIQESLNSINTINTTEK